MKIKYKSNINSIKNRTQIFVYGFLLFLFPFSFCFSQNIQYLQEQDYTFKKQNGQLNSFDFLQPNSEILIPIFEPETNPKQPNQKASGCGGFVQDIGPAYVMTWNTDDGSAPIINLPFTFCFFGDNYTSLYMNNNGNISFLSPNSSFNAYAFPSNINRIIAGFWSDFDFGSCGTMHTNISPTSAVFTWKDVGYYNEKCDKKTPYKLS